MIKGKINRLLRRTSTEKKFWSKAARADDLTTMSRICDGFTKRQFEKEIIPFFHPHYILKKTDNVLDLACGMGRTCKWVAPQVEQYTGVDFIPEMVQKAKQHNRTIQNANFVINDGLTLKTLPDGSFDLVYCELAFQHMKKDVQKSYIPEVYRVLKKHGLFMAQLPKMSYYDNPDFALTNSEMRKMFEMFDIDLVSQTPAYYVLLARKA